MKKLSLIVATLIAVPAFAQNWPSFRGNAAAGVAAETAPVQWDIAKSDNIAWKTAIPGLAHASPVVWGTRVFVVTAIASEGTPALKLGMPGIDAASDMVTHTWKLFALDRATGKIIWEQAAHAGVPRIKRHVKASHASATPATDGRFIVALLGSEGLFCYTVEGKLKWKADLGLLDTGLLDDPSYQWGPASSPVIYKNLVIVQNDRHKDSFFAAYNLETGKEVWRTASRGRPSWASPTVVPAGARDVLVANSPLEIRGLDPATGKELWKLARETQVQVPTPVGAGDLVIVTGGYPGNGNPIYAIRADAAGEITKGKGLAWSTERGSPYTPTPLVHGGQLYVLQDNGVVVSYQAATGVEIYRQRIAPASFSASPVAAGDKVYFASEDGDVYVIRAGSKYELLATNRMGETCFATPAIAQNTLFVRTQSHLYAIRETRNAGPRAD